MVSTVYCLLSTLYVLCCVVLLCCVVGCGMAVVCEGAWFRCLCSLFLFFFFFLFVLVFGVVRAQPSEHARNPRTPLRCPFSFSSSSCFSSLLSFCAPPFCVLEWRRVIHHVSVCCVGMTAMGSLSLSSSFFW